MISISTKCYCQFSEDREISPSLPLSNIVKRSIGFLCRLDVAGWASNGSWNPKQLSENAFYMGVIASILHKIRCIIQLTLFWILFACGDSLWKFVHSMDIQILSFVISFNNNSIQVYSYNNVDVTIVVTNHSSYVTNQRHLEFTVITIDALKYNIY